MSIEHNLETTDDAIGTSAASDALLDLLRATRPYVEAGLYLSEHGSKSQADIFNAAETLQRIDAALHGKAR